MERTSVPLLIVGGGNMGRALVRGGLDAGRLEPGRVAVLEPSAHAREVFRPWGVRTLGTPAEAGSWLGEVERSGVPAQILLAIKPQSLDEVARQLMPVLGARRRVVISILAGTPSRRVRDRLGGVVAVIRAMPNLAASVRRSTTALAAGEDVGEGEDELARRLFEAIGRVVVIPEDLMDAFTAIAGSGPAYVFYLTEAMARAGEQMGFDSDTAHWMARWTVAGAGALLDATDQPPETLRAAVTSPGGTTAAAVGVLDRARTMDTLVQAMIAARDRGRELARSEGGDVGRP